jgi:hypothetical protein
MSSAISFVRPRRIPLIHPVNSGSQRWWVVSHPLPGGCASLSFPSHRPPLHHFHPTRSSSWQWWGCSLSSLSAVIRCCSSSPVLHLPTPIPVVLIVVVVGSLSSYVVSSCRALHWPHCWACRPHPSPLLHFALAASFECWGCCLGAGSAVALVIVPSTHPRSTPRAVARRPVSWPSFSIVRVHT